MFLEELGYSIKQLDHNIFDFIHSTIRNPLFDHIMPLLSWNPLFAPGALILAALLIWKHKIRGLMCVSMLVLGILFVDCLVSKSIKDAISRPRPFASETLNTESSSTNNQNVFNDSMPSSHAMNWFAALVIMRMYFRKSLKWVLPVAVLVSFSRIYNGSHYPSDVLVGAVVGASSGFVMIWAIDKIWQSITRRYLPALHKHFPSLILKETPTQNNFNFIKALDQNDHQWLRLGYLLIATLCLARLIYVGSGVIELSEDEAYQWLWSKHLDWSYYSKPPLIAISHFISTSIFGDSAFGIRAFAPIITAIISILILRFMAKEASPRAAFWAIAVTIAMPMLCAGALLMTVDVLSVFFWTLAMITGWQAIKTEKNSYWLATGLCIGLGFLSKYTGFVQILSFLLFFILSSRYRSNLSRPGPYLALLVALICCLPVVIWNAQHNWITVNHLISRGGLDTAWRFSLKYIFEFLATEFLLLNPGIFAGSIIAVIGLLKNIKHAQESELYLLSMSSVLIIMYSLLAFKSRVLPNWIVPAVIPLTCLTIIYWDKRWSTAATWLKKAFFVCLTLGFLTVIIGHETNLVGKITSKYLPPKKDPLRRVRAWDKLANVVREEWIKLQDSSGPAFIIANHYGLTSILSFYIPEAKKAVTTRPIVYYKSSKTPQNQFFFWKSYSDHQNENAIFVMEAKEPQQPPPELLAEFESVSDLGLRTVYYKNRPFHTVQIFMCKKLKFAEHN